MATRSDGRRPYIYVRKSKVIRDKNVISPEVQLTEVRELAERHRVDPEDLVYLEDLNISGRKGRAKRPGYHRLLTAIEGGQVSVLFSYSLSRLSRRVSDILELVDLCHKAGVPIHLARDVDPDPTTASGRLMLAIIAAMAQFESDVTSERMLDLADFRRGRGDKLGGSYYGDKPGEDPAAVRAAFEQAGTLAGAARILNESGVPTRNAAAGSTWMATSVRGILRRIAPEILPVHHSQGVPSRKPYWFYRLVVCHCGRVMTGRRDKWRPGRQQATLVRYICLSGRVNPDHGPAYVSERVLRAAVEEELATLVLPFDGVAQEQAEEDRAAIADLRARRERLGWAMVDGAIERDAGLAEQARIDEEIERLELAGRVWDLELEVDWDAVEEANAVLSALFEPIRFAEDGSVKPLVLRVPRLRRPAGPHVLPAGG